MSDIINGLATVSLGMILLCLSLLGIRPDLRARLPLVLVLSLVGLILLPAALPHTLAPNILPFGLWAHLALAPALWLYVAALTADTPFALRKHHLRHALIPVFGLIVPALTLLLPLPVREAMLMRGEAVNEPWALGLAVMAFGLILLWIGQSSVYIWQIERRLSTYRKRLRDVYANTDGRELRWLSLVTALIGGLWGLLLLSTAIEAMGATSPVPASALYLPAFLGIWALAVFGLSQRPGFEGRYAEAADASATQAQAKYSRSALTEPQAQRIAARLDKAMQDQQLYLDPTLSLPALSKRVGISANNISQTLNGHLNETFFEYINRWRAEAARPLLMETDKTVLEIALEVGFNSKSAFYSAFRRATGTTPTACRKAG
ncbi:helix-turn-helix domain-containing protein [Asticcacaulis machinosus]|uniref:AraC family transcriptional regulator n=1 Tax=Asticcacaulis machinosus TaxID=2984211 RepID=A0ABT5HHR6_9CAUL|nr:AraC family transcriptional regulator [Asticcacaulis machinosus]MDC7675780.1 AraC family transcriptional regulator [Asticcacaulis machinosus]